MTDTNALYRYMYCHVHVSEPFSFALVQSTHYGVEHGDHIKQTEQ